MSLRFSHEPKREHRFAPKKKTPFNPMAPRGRHLASAAVLAATAVCAGVMVVRLSWAGPRPAALLADVCGRAHGSMLRQDALCGALCRTDLADCGTCGGTNVNIFQSGPGAFPEKIYPGYGAYAYAAYPGYACVDQSSYDPWLWYDYYFKYDPYLAPYYEPWSAPEASAEGEEPASAEEPAPEEEEEPVEKELPPAEEEEPEGDRPHAQPAGTSTAGSFTLSGKSISRKRSSTMIRADTDVIKRRAARSSAPRVFRFACCFP